MRVKLRIKLFLLFTPLTVSQNTKLIFMKHSVFHYRLYSDEKNPFDPRNLGNAFLSQLNNYYTKALDAQARTEKSLLGNNP